MRERIKARGLSKRFEEDAGVHDLTFELPAGEEGSVSVLLGPNGAGKSTLLRLVLGLLKPETGQLHVLGLDPVRHADRVHARVAFVPDTPDAPGWMTPKQLFGFLAPRYATWDAECAERLSTRFEIPMKTPLRNLSRGQAARAMLVAALAQSPELILLDEPFSGIDPVARREHLQVFIEELHRLSATALISTHELEIAARIADHVLILAHGRLVACGPVDQVLGHTQDEPARIPAQLLDLLEGLTRNREEVAA